MEGDKGHGIFVLTFLKKNNGDRNMEWLVLGGSTTTNHASTIKRRSSARGSNMWGLEKLDVRSRNKTATLTLRQNSPSTMHLTICMPF